MLENIKKIFFYRVCGTGMGACAIILREKGFDVEGGDYKYYPPMSTYLKKSEIECHDLNEVTDEYLKNFDLIVVGNVVPRASDDAKRIESLGVNYCSFPKALGNLILKDSNVVGIAGTHGKTTTTFLAVQVFENLGMTPGYLIGGVIDDRPSARIGDGKYFFIESDEYDSAYFEKISKFRSYELNHLILTSLEFDHADIFDDIEDIKKEFKELNVPGHHIFCEDYAEVKNLYPKKNVLYYGNNIFIEKESESGTFFSLNFKGDTFSFETSLVGKHNIYNLASVIFFGLKENIKYEDLKTAVRELSLVKRRQEFKGHINDAPVIDDFAHHPTAVHATIDAIKARYPNKKIVVVFEPHSATARSSLFENDFFKSLSAADSVGITKLNRPTSVKSAQDLNIHKMAKDLKDGHVLEDLDGLLSFLQIKLTKDSVCLVLSNGTCLGLWESGVVKK